MVKVVFDVTTSMKVDGGSGSKLAVQVYSPVSDVCKEERVRVDR